MQVVRQTGSPPASFAAATWKPASDDSTRKYPPPAVRVHPARAGDTAGSGLGLSIVKAIVERHGGTIAVASTLGRSTEFTIHLPQA